MTDRDRASCGCVEAVVFDMDGIIFDTEPLYLEAGRELLARRGHHLPLESGVRIIGMTTLGGMRFFKEAFSLPNSEVDLAAEYEAIFWDLRTRGLRLMPGLLDLLDQMEARGLMKAIATSASPDVTADLLETFHLTPRFAFALTAQDVACGKPHPEIYRKACSRLGLRPGRVLVLEDSLNGVLAAKEAGCGCVAVPNELTCHLDFSAADLTVSHLMDERLLARLGR